MNFWQELKSKGTPIIGLSPMDGLTDGAFRFILAKYTKPDVIFTEFVNIDGIYFSREDIFEPFLYHNIERPVVAQVFGIEPKLFYLAAQVIAELGFNGMDINMGCPSKNVSSRGAGAGLIKTPELAAEIVRSAKQGIADWVREGISPEMSARAKRKLENTRSRLIQLGTTLPDFSLQSNRKSIPVSVKTRTGYSENEISRWLPQILEMKPANITLHGRTFKQLYAGKADWEAIAAAAELVRDYNRNLSSDEQMTFLGNGDIMNFEDAINVYRNYKLDGVLIGRAVLGDPWILLPEASRPKGLKEKLPVILEHAKMHEQLFPERFFSMRKHLAWYFKGFPGASDLRQQLVQTNNSHEVEGLIYDSQLLTR